MKTKYSTTNDQEALDRLENLDPEDPHVSVRDRSAVAALEAAAQARRAAEELVTAAVREARQEGATWTEIGIALGVTHQAAIKRYGRGSGAAEVERALRRAKSGARHEKRIRTVEGQIRTAEKKMKIAEGKIKAIVKAEDAIKGAEKATNSADRAVRAANRGGKG